MIWNAILLAFRDIRRNVMRSSLTMLGIVIGVAAVITMVTLGRGATERVTADIVSLGSNLLHVRQGQRFRGHGGVRSAADPFDLQDVKAIAREISGVAAAAPVTSQTVLSVYGNENWTTSVVGSDNAFFKTRKWSIESGRQFIDSELRVGKPVCILGNTVRKELFGAQSPLGASIRLGKLSCQVIGVLEPKGLSTFGRDQDDIVVVPVRAFQRRISGNQDINAIYVSAQSGDVTEKVKQDIELLMRQRRHISATEEDDFYVRDMKELVARVTSTTRVLTALLGAVAAVSLVVGGIGIMNIMLVSVTERTREIGIRIAIGALERDVLRQFLVEAIVLSSLGGVVGIVLGLASCAIGAPMLGVPFIFDPVIMVIAVAFSGAIGVIFGYFPARKAARLDPIEALRHE
ncbi:MAG: ABC transporter permease [Deltaproteobacteria bacterium]|nr:ABC transporter permease [Deltaproteobacteria bacterium]